MIPHANGRNYEEEEEEELPYDYEKAKKVKWYDTILLNRPLKIIVAIILLAVIVPVLVYRYLFFTSVDWPPPDGFSLGSCFVQRSARLMCGPDDTPHSACHQQCCYDLDNNMCFHRFPSRFSYIMDQPWTQDVILRPRIATVPFTSQNSIVALKLSIDEISSTHLSLTFYDAREASLEGSRIGYKDYEYRISSPELNVIVDGLNGTIFNTARGPLIAADNIWEISFKLTDETIYGLGDLPLIEGAVKMIYSHDGGLSALPLIYAKSNGSYHGLLIDTDNPTELSVKGENQIVLRSITKFGLKLHLFLGPEPKDVMRGVMDHLGHKKQLEYWMLGAHICSEITEDPFEATNNLQSFIINATSYNLPYDSHCGGRPIVFNAHNVTEDTEAVEAAATLLRNAGKRFVPHVSPYIRYEQIEMEDEEYSDNEASAETMSNGVCINLVCEFEQFLLRSPTSEIYNGSVDYLEEPLVYPDYETVTEEFLKKLWAYNINVDVDGLVLENNWPLDESLKSHNETYLQLPYFSENFEEAFNHTPQWNIIKPSGEEYLYKHNMYGNKVVEAFEKVSDGIYLQSTSQWMKTNVVVNRQNIDASWTNLQKELVEAALGGVSGHWLWSSPVCGDTSSFDAENQASLCVKWYLAATFMPLLKIHSKTEARDPLAFRGTQRTLMMYALNDRLAFLPYFYTVLQEGPLLRPMFYQFPLSDVLSDLDSQFSVGDDLLIAPNLQPSQSHVHVTIPPGTWYEFWSGLKIDAEEGQRVTMTTTEADLLTFIRGGAIVVTQKETRTTADLTRKTSAFSLVIATEAVNVTRDELTTEECVAEGKLYLSSNLTIHLTMNSTDLIISTEDDDFDSVCGDDAVWFNVIREVKIYGLPVTEDDYDHYKEIRTAIDLCDLKNGEIVYALFS